MKTCLAVFRVVLPGLTVGLLGACGGGGYGGGGDSAPRPPCRFRADDHHPGQSATLLGPRMARAARRAVLERHCPPAAART